MRTSNIERRTLNFEQKRRKQQTPRLIFLSSVQRWMFNALRALESSEKPGAALTGMAPRSGATLDVRCSHFSLPASFSLRFNIDRKMMNANIEH